MSDIWFEKLRAMEGVLYPPGRAPGGMWTLSRSTVNKVYYGDTAQEVIEEAWGEYATLMKYNVLTIQDIERQEYTEEVDNG